MRILHYIPTYAPAWTFGGPVRSVSTLCEGLVTRGHEVTVLTTDAGLKIDDVPARGQEVLRNGVKVHYFPQVPGYGIKSPELEAAVGNFVKGQDLVHVTAIWQRTGSAACRAARRAGVPYVISPRGALGPYSWGRGTIKKLAYYFLQERRNLSEASGFHYTSAMEAAECERFRFGKPSCTVANGIDFQQWSRNEGGGVAWRKAKGIAANARVLLYAGRLHHKKGLDLLPSALKKMADDNSLMVFVGRDEDGTGQRLKAEFASLGLSSKVRFLPGVDSGELVEVYSGADLFLLPSLHENFGNVAVEAASCGCWVLASDKVGVARELADLGAGECLSRDFGTWTSAIAHGPRTAIRDTSQGNKLARVFDIRATAKSMENFYQTLSEARNRNA